MKLSEKLLKKQGELREAIDKADEIVSNPDSEQRSIDEALDAVKVLDDDVKNIKSLLEAEQETTSDTSDDSEDEAEPADDSASRDNEPADEEINESEAPEPEDQKQEKEARSMPIKINENTNPKNEQRDALNAFIHTRGEKRDGIKSDDVGVLIPEEIINNPDIMINSTTDLSKLVTKTKVKTSSGKYPILARPSTVLPSVEELEENPELAKPKFTDVKWEVATYRGALPISQESIDDAQADLLGLVGEFISQIKVNTTNSKIAAVLSKFKSMSVASVDELKDLNNTGFDPAYQLSWVMTKSFYNELDKVKDGEGRYLLQDQIGSETGKTLFGHNLTIVEDTAFGGKDGAKQAFIGDLKRAVLYADRVEANIDWVVNEIYGRQLMAVIRFGTTAADENAGYFVKIDGSLQSESAGAPAQEQPADED